MPRLAPLLLVLVAGCGSMSPADLPAPAGPPASPPLTARPAGAVHPDAIITLPGSPSVDRARATLTVNGRTVRTCQDPIQAATLGRGTRVAVLCGRERTLDLYDLKTLERVGRAGAGIGPTGLSTDLVDILYVIDTLGESLLVYHQHPFELLRRVHLGGGPYAIAFDRERWGLWITLNGANQLVNYSAGTRPVIRERFPSIADARDVTVGADKVLVFNDRETQTLRLRSR